MNRISPATSIDIAQEELKTSQHERADQPTIPKLVNEQEDEATCSMFKGMSLEQTIQLCNNDTCEDFSPEDISPLHVHVSTGQKGKRPKSHQAVFPLSSITTCISGFENIHISDTDSISVKTSISINNQSKIRKTIVIKDSTLPVCSLPVHKINIPSTYISRISKRRGGLHSNSLYGFSDL